MAKKTVMLGAMKPKFVAPGGFSATKRNCKRGPAAEVKEAANRWLRARGMETKLLPNGFLFGKQQ